MQMDDDILDRVEVFEAWKAMSGETVAAYFTDSVAESNLQAIAEWSASRLPGGIASSKEIGFFEIGFRECLKNGLLVADETYVSRSDRKATYQKLYAQLTASQARGLYENREQITPELTDSQKADLAKIGGFAAFKTFTDAQ